MKTFKALSIIFFTLFLIFSCNPVKQVLNNPARMNEMAGEMIRRGYCSNDTTIINQITDTVYIKTQDDIDTLVMEQGICNFDTTLKSGTRIKFENGYLIVKERKSFSTRVVTKTVNNYITDNSQIDLLKKDIVNYKDTVLTLKGSLDTYKETNENLVKKLSNTKLYLILSIVFIILSFLWRLFKKLKTPVL